jgi:DNA-binding transcriptional LysR family regulator
VARAPLSDRRYLIADLLGSGALVPVLPDYRAPESELVAAYPHRRYLPVKVRAFINRLVDRFAGEPLWKSGKPS